MKYNLKNLWIAVRNSNDNIPISNHITIANDSYNE